MDELKEKLAHLPTGPGVYLMKDAQVRVLYIGKAKNLRSRVMSYFQPSSHLETTRGPHIAEMVAQVADVDFLNCRSHVDATLQEARLIKDIHPKYNIRLTDDKTFPYLEITTREDFPGVYITRKPQPGGSKLYGPFVNVKDLREVVQLLQKVFKFRTCRLQIKEGDESRRFFRPCLLYFIKQCSGPCAALIDKKQYRANIVRLKQFLDSKRTALLRNLRRQMEAASAAQNYELAAELRDQLKALESLSQRGEVDEHVQPEVFHIDPRSGLEQLQQVLALPEAPRSIEGIDVANIAGAETVGSLVSFIDGRPFKAGYRRFRIKTVRGIDDYACIAEIIRRRYRHAAESHELYPDVILVDGGLGQLHVAMEAFSQMSVRPPMVVALAKKQEKLFVQGKSEPLVLPRNSPALRLLQYVRDEAHRFAQHYHHILRRKRTFDEDFGKRRGKGKSSSQ